MLKQADFSKETDLKQRLHDRLFGRQVVKFPGARRELGDDLLDLVSAAGETAPEDPEKKEMLKRLLKQDTE